MRPHPKRTMAWTLTGLLIAVSLAPAAAPRFELEGPAGMGLAAGAVRLRRQRGGH